MIAQLRRLSILAVVLFAPQVVLADAASEQAASQLLRDRMRNERPDDARLLDAVEGKDIIVVAGSMDRVQQVLRATGVRHQMIGPGDVGGFDFNMDQVVMVNCPGRIPRKGLTKLEKFVRAGGTLYTTDWALKNVIQKIFPGTIRSNGRSTADHVVPVQVHDSEDNLMTGMLLRRKTKPQWWLEGGSYPIEILDKEKVEVLASSKQMKRRYGSGAVVVKFRWHDGQVIHVVSHFYRQLRTRGPAIAAKSAVDQMGGLTAAQKLAFKASSGGKANLGDVESSYAFQQMTANLVVQKQKRNEELDRLYDMTPSADVVIEGRKLSKGARLQVLSRRAGRVRVRDDRGNEAELDEDVIETR